MGSRVSKTGIISATIFLVSFAALFSYLLYSAHTNHADSGEGGILLLPFGMPWIFMFPESARIRSIMPQLLCISALLNTVLLYFIFGGLAALVRKKPAGNTP